MENFHKLPDNRVDKVDKEKAGEQAWLRLNQVGNDWVDNVDHIGWDYQVDLVYWGNYLDEIDLVFHKHKKAARTGKCCR